MRNGLKFMDRCHLKGKKIRVCRPGDIHTWLQLPSNSKLEKSGKNRIKIPWLRFIWNWWLFPKEIHRFHGEDPSLIGGTKTHPSPWVLRRSPRKRELGIMSASKREMEQGCSKEKQEGKRSFSKGWQSWSSVPSAYVFPRNNSLWRG